MPLRTVRPEGGGAGAGGGDAPDMVVTVPSTPLAQGIPHTTVAGERWDTLAWTYYGDPTNYSGIIMANPSIPIEPEFEPGLFIIIPIITAAAAAPPNLPPWQTL